MSMKFFAGLQDFLGLHDTSSSNNEQQQQQEQQLVSSASTTATTPPAVVVGAATTSSLLSSPSVLSANLNSIESERNSVKYISDISNNCTVVQKEQQQLQKITLDDSKEITDAEEKIQHCSHRRNVHFPDVIVTDFYDAPTNVFTNKNANDTSAISLSYLNACRRLRIDPIQTVQEQIAVIF
ncbi:unnamed protein product [Brugia timori]|uniref:Uncharacterized protein n=1 Tax=Brugia timori TaxID=42155 RepID=A0A0R3Q6V6_9BILA|nr:unnamed protein product [Brugia timori]